MSSAYHHLTVNHPPTHSEASMHTSKQASCQLTSCLAAGLLLPASLEAQQHWLP